MRIILHLPKQNEPWAGGLARRGAGTMQNPERT